ncbi:MAG: lipase secretion chaperone [Psychrobacter sp.]|nr:lipase secretion chaperone [Psychrobacter sp.]
MPKPRRNQLFIIIAIIVFLALLAALIWWLKPKTETTANPQLGASSTSQTVGSDNEVIMPVPTRTEPSNNQSAFSTGLEHMPKSLRDTEVDGEIIIDENKQLVVTEGLRRLFDYFLSALGEEDEATIIERVEAYIRHHTPEPAASQAIEIFHQYVAYLKALDGIQKNYGNLQLQATQNGEMDLNLISQRRQDVNKLRQQFFTTETISAFFGSDDAYDEYSLAMLKIAQDDSLNDAQKQAAREDYISRLPEGTIKKNVQQQANFGLLMQRTEELKRKGASSDELFAMRSKLVGEAAARRLAKVDDEDANFDARFSQYQTQRQALVAQAGSEAAASAQIAQLEQQMFNETERKRLSGYAALKQAQQQDTDSQ